MTTPDHRMATAAILRAVADLIETRENVPLPSCDIDFYVHGEDVPATMAAIASALPCQWHAEISRGSSYEWLHLRSDPPGSSVVVRGARVKVGANTADACVEAGAKTVTVWQPREAITALLGGRPVEGAQ